MVKFVLITAVTIQLIAQPPSPLLQKNCIECHIKQKIPSELIYRRYLMRYSTHKEVKKTLLEYLTAPSKENSIMPKQFFLKFPIKRALDLNETVLRKSIEEYLDFFDVRGRLVLQEDIVNYVLNSSKLFFDLNIYDLPTFNVRWRD